MRSHIVQLDRKKAELRHSPGPHGEVEVGWVTSQDRLIIIPCVTCGDVTRGTAAVRRGPPLPGIRAVPVDFS